jgi:HlyD family secretion protein
MNTKNQIQLVNCIKKRDGTTQDFNLKKIASAVFKAMTSVGNGTMEDADKISKEVSVRVNQKFNTTLEANTTRIKSELEIAGRDYNRFLEVFKEGAISQTVLDTYRLKVETLQGQLMQSQQQVQQARFQLSQSQGLLSSVREVRPTDVQFAEAQLQTAIVNVKKAEVDLDLAQVRAPIDGQVLKINSKIGEVVSQTNGLIDLGNTSQMYVVAEIYETDIGKIKVGQKATIESEAFEGDITGKVDRIGLRIAKNDVLGTDPAAKTDVRIIEVKIKLDDSTKVSGLTNLQVRVKVEM